ncbi:lipocalin-like domain-containing protein [Vibrio sp.]|uniref:lipocalin-like domain-containing protein n=1 Tax=Vibrio sp. TaxID=678 RepID=UPI003D11F6B5
MTKPTSLLEQLIGAWSLVSYVEKPLDGSEPIYPFGKSPKGIIMYTPDGYMSAQISTLNRPHFASGDWFKGSEKELANEASSYIAYTGPFDVDEETHSLTHTMFISLFPNWTGQTQPRKVKLEGKSLWLSTASPIISGGKEVHSYLHWLKMR